MATKAQTHLCFCAVCDYFLSILAEKRTLTRAPARILEPGGGNWSTAAPEPSDCKRKPDLKQSSVTCRKDFPSKSGTVRSPNCQSSAVERGLKFATTYLPESFSTGD